MNILRVISSMHPSKGGPCQGIRNAIPFLQKVGITNDVVCMDDENTAYPVVDNFNVYKVGSGKTSYQYQPQLIKWLDKNVFNYDFVIVHGLWQFHNIAVYESIKNNKQHSQKIPKVIIMPHGMLDPYFQKSPDRKWKAFRNELVWSFIEKKCVNKADAIFFTCEEEMKLANNTFKGYNPQNAINVGYGIQMPPKNNYDLKKEFYEVCPGIKDKKYFLFLSRIHDKKGVDLLIKAYNALVDDFSDLSDLPDLVIAGPIESNYAKEMIQIAAKNAKIHFPGMLVGNVKWGAFYNCQLYILPSHQENFGIAIVEAMACNKPVLISKNINIWKEIEEGNAGWILEELDSRNIKKQLENIIKISSSDFDKKGQNAFETYRDKFDVEKCSSIFAASLQRILKDNFK